MTKALLRIVLLLIAGTCLILLIEHYDADMQSRKQSHESFKQLQQIGYNLQQQMDQLVSNGKQLAQELAADQGLLERLDQHPIIRDLGDDPAELTISFTRKFEVAAAFPVVGTESVLGINFFLSPEFMSSIRRALASRDTIIDSKVTLRQTDRQGIIIRTPYFDAHGNFLGLVTCALDLQAMLAKAGWPGKEAEFKLLIKGQFPDSPAINILGNGETRHQLSAPVTIRVPENGVWLLQAKARSDNLAPSYRSDAIRLSSGAVLLLITFFQLRRCGVLNGFLGVKKGLSLHSSILLIAIVPIVTLVMAIALLSFNATQQAAERLMQQQAGDLARQIRGHVEAFFDVPHQAAFDVELFRNGVLDPDNPSQMLSIFLSQLRVQPQLTFISMANSQGEYYAASRPPAGSDRNVRLQFATLETNREMRVHWVAQANKPSKTYVRGTDYFDARDTVWYQQAINNNGMRWYPVYHYETKDERNQYLGLGMGISSAVYDKNNRFIGVISADVAMLQLSEFLHERAGTSGHTIFIAETGGNLLATSDNTPVHLEDEEYSGAMRISMKQSQNPLIRKAGLAIEKQQSGTGNMFIIEDNKRHLLNWQTISLPDGPSMLVATIMPQSWVGNTAIPVLRDVLYLAALLLVLGVIAVLFLVNWLTKPLLRLEAWASKLGQGQWQAELPPASPVREINSLTKSLGCMATQLRNHADELEQRVASRTHELAVANHKLAELSLTDALTGIANRRSFDRFIKSEWNRAQRYGHCIALMIIDIDNFKAYNDRYGHQAGDRVLSQAASTLAEKVRREGELISRYGGEEFAVVLTRTSLHSALDLAETLRAVIYDLEIEHPDSTAGRLSISIGVSAQSPTPQACIEEFFAAADSALYQAKKQGRNRVCHVARP